MVVLVMLGLFWPGQSQLKLGCGLNLFGRYGFLSISMRVVPRHDLNSSWIFREPTVQVFNNISPPLSCFSVAPRKNSIFHGDFHMEFCDDLPQLLQAYFREFSIELLDKPWEAFTDGWSDVTLAKYLGLNSSYVESGHCYILLRVSRYWQSGKMTGLEHATLQEAVENQAKLVQVGNVPSVVEFIKRFGSHFISSYITGNSLFQVIVYSPEVYKKIKDKLQKSGITSADEPELRMLFSPWYAEHLGLVLSASGNQTLAEWAKSTLKARFYFLPYISLLKLHGDSKLLKELDYMLGNEALLHLNLKTLASIFRDVEKKKWFEEVIDNNLKLWEINL